MSQRHYTAPKNHRSTSPRSKLAAAVGGVVAALWVAAPATALNFTLSIGGSGTWTGGNWNPSAPITQPGDVALTNALATLNTSLNVDPTIGTIRSTVTGGGANWNITGTTNTITMNNNGAEAQIFTNGSGNLSIAPNIIITNNNLFIGQVASGGNNAVGNTNVTVGGNITVAGDESRTLALRSTVAGSTAAVIINGTIGATSTGSSTINIAANGGATGSVASFSLTNNIGGAVGVASTVTISNTNAGTAGLSITGALGESVTTVTQNSVNGSTTLSGNNSNYVGATTLSAGTLFIGSDTALGASAATLWIGSGTTINTSGGIRNLTATNAITVNGSFNFTGTNSLGLAGPVTLNTSAVTINALGSTLTLAGGIGETSAGSSLTKSGAGNLVLQGNSSFSGSMTVSGGAVTLSGNGSIASATGGVVVRNGRTLTLDNAATNNTNRIAGPLTLVDGSSFELLANSSASVTETIGDLNLGSGGQIITIGTASGQNNTLAAGVINRTDFATALVRGTSLAQGPGTFVSKITLTAAPTLVGTNSLSNAAAGDTTQALKIVPYLIGGTSLTSNGTNFVTYDSVLGLRQLAAAQQTALNAGSTTAASPINATAGTNITLNTTGDLRVNSLLGSNNAILNGSGGTLTIDSGAIATAGGALTIGHNFSSVILGNGEGVITTPSGNSMTFHSPINVTSGGALVRTGTSSLFLAADNLWTGQTIINQGLFQLGLGGNTGNLAANADTVTITSGTNAALRWVRNNDFTVNSTIVGAGSVSKYGAGNMTVTSSNSFGAQMLINGGKVTFDAANAAAGTNANYALSTGTEVRLEGGTIEFKAKAGAGNTTNQTINGLVIGQASGIGTVIVNRNGSAGMNLNIGGLTQGGNTFGLFDLSSGSTVTTTSLTGTNGTTLIKDGTSRIDYAIAVANNLQAVNAATDFVATGGSNATNYRLNGSQTLTGGVAARTVRIDTTGTGQSLDLGSNNINFSFTGGPGGVLFVGAHDFTITGSSGTFGSSGALNVHQYGTGKLTMAALMGNTGGAAVILGGNGLIDWNRVSGNVPTSAASGLNQFTGVTVRLSDAGAINLTNATTLTAGAGNLNINGGAIVELASGNFTRDIGTTTGKVQFLGSGGFSAFGADRTVSLSSNNGANAGATLSWVAASPNLTPGFLIDGSALILGSNYSTHMVTVTNALDLGTVNRVIEARDGADNGTNGAAIDGKLSGIISGTMRGGITKTGTGTLELSNTNTYAGGTIVAAGKLRVTGTLGSGDVTVASGATLEIVDGDSIINAIANTATLELGLVEGVEGVANLNFTGYESVGKLILGGVTYTSGFFDSNTNPEYFTGNGAIAVPEPGVAMLGLAGAGVLAMRRRSRRTAAK